MSGVGNAYPFMSLAVLLGYGAFRTGAVLPCVAVHLLLDLLTLAFFAGSISDTTRLAVACAVLFGFAAGIMPAGRRLGIRRRVPSVIDLRTPDVIDLRDPATLELPGSPGFIAASAAPTARD